MTGATTTTAPTTAQLQMPTKNVLTLMMVTLQTMATGRCSNFQAVPTHNCTQHMYVAYACVAHNIKLLSKDASFSAEADLVFICDIKLGDEAG